MKSPWANLLTVTVAVAMTHALAQSYPGGGYGGSGGGLGGGGYGGGGLGIARVNAAPSGFAGGGLGGFGGAQGGLNGGGQGFGGSGGGGLHGVTRRTFMSEPNTIAAQYFSAAGVPVASPAAAANTAYGGGFGGAGAFGANRPVQPLNGRPGARAWVRQTGGARPVASLAAASGYPRAGVSRDAVALQTKSEAATPATPALTASQMAGVAPAETPAAKAEPPAATGSPVPSKPASAPPPAARFQSRPLRRGAAR